MKKRFLKIRQSKPYRFLKDKFLYYRAWINFKINPYPSYIGKEPIFIFNHIPKCGGTSLNIVLRKWFHFVRDYPLFDLQFSDPKGFDEVLTLFKKNPPILNELKSFQIIAGHYDSPSYFLNNRFPILELGNKVKVITFLRDPLSQRVSAYTYGIKMGHQWVQGLSLKDFIFLRGNLFAQILDCNESNFCEKLDNYFFIGVLENYELSINLLAQKIGKRLNFKIPNVNRTDSSNRIYELDNNDIIEFKKRNSLDYKIYAFAKKKLLQI